MWKGLPLPDSCISGLVSFIWKIQARKLTPFFGHHFNVPLPSPPPVPLCSWIYNVHTLFSFLVFHNFVFPLKKYKNLTPFPSTDAFHDLYLPPAIQFTLFFSPRSRCILGSTRAPNRIPPNIWSVGFVFYFFVAKSYPFAFSFNLVT